MQDFTKKDIVKVVSWNYIFHSIPYLHSTFLQQKTKNNFFTDMYYFSQTFFKNPETITFK